MPPKEVRLVLQLLPYLDNLREMSFDTPYEGIKSNTLFAPDAWRITFSHLTRLAISSRMRQFPISLIDSASFPSLYDFTYTISGSPPDGAAGERYRDERLLAFVNKHQTLRRLQISYTDGFRRSPCGLLSSFSALKLDSFRIFGRWDNGRASPVISTPNPSTLKEVSIGQQGAYRSPWGPDSEEEESAQLLSRPLPQMPQLTSIQLGIKFELDEQFFAWLGPVLPQLTKLWISYPTFGTGDFERLHEACPVTSKSPLESLVLRFEAPTVESYLALSDLFPNLRVLKQIFSYGMDDFFKSSNYSLDSIVSHSRATSPASYLSLL